MCINKDTVVGIMPLMPQGTNSTLFTECCGAAICSDEKRCPQCKRLVIGYDAETYRERLRIRWKYATRFWKR